MAAYPTFNLYSSGTTNSSIISGITTISYSYPSLAYNYTHRTPAEDIFDVIRKDVIQFLNLENLKLTEEDHKQIDIEITLSENDVYLITLDFLPAHLTDEIKRHIRTILNEETKKKLTGAIVEVSVFFDNDTFEIFRERV